MGNQGWPGCNGTEGQAGEQNPTITTEDLPCLQVSLLAKPVATNQGSQSRESAGQGSGHGPCLGKGVRLKSPPAMGKAAPAFREAGYE